MQARHPPAPVRTEALQHQPAVFRTSCRKSRDSCLVSRDSWKTLPAAARTVLSSRVGASPTGADGVFVPDNGVITFNLNRLPGQKKTEALQYQRALFRTSCLKKAVIRVSCLVFRENLAGRGTGGPVVSRRRVPDGCGWGFRSRQRRHHFQPKPPLPAKKKTEALQYQRALFRTSCRKKAVIRVSCLVFRGKPCRPRHGRPCRLQAARPRRARTAFSFPTTASSLPT